MSFSLWARDIASVVVSWLPKLYLSVSLLPSLYHHIPFCPLYYSLPSSWVLLVFLSLSLPPPPSILHVLWWPDWKGWANVSVVVCELVYVFAGGPLSLMMVPPLLAWPLSTIDSMPEIIVFSLDRSGFDWEELGIWITAAAIWPSMCWESIHRWV